MTTFYLVRHGVHDLQGRVLLGRSDSLGLSVLGWRQAKEAARHLSDKNIALVQSSPSRRCIETAEEIAHELDLEFETADVLDEVDYGRWTGLPFDRLANDTVWRLWNERRDAVRVPGGETMQDVRRRTVQQMRCVAALYPQQSVVLVTHAENIRAALLHQQRVPLREYWRFDVQPGSITRLQRDVPRLESCETMLA